MTNSSEASLYERLGGYDAVAAASDDLLARMTSDPQLGHFWAGHSNDSMRRDRQLLVDFMVEATGGPAFYRGRDMKTSHVGIGISDDDWKVFLVHLEAMMDHFEIPEKEQEEVNAAMDSLKGDIVEDHVRASAWPV